MSFLSDSTHQHRHRTACPWCLVRYAPACSPRGVCRTCHTDKHTRIRTTQHQEYKTENSSCNPRHGGTRAHAEAKHHCSSTGCSALQSARRHAQARRHHSSTLCAVHVFLPKAIMNCASRGTVSFKSSSISASCLFVWFLFASLRCLTLGCLSTSICRQQNSSNSSRAAQQSSSSSRSRAAQQSSSSREAVGSSRTAAEQQLR